MKVKQIKDIIKEVITGELPCKSILIDGRWGCGKTTIIQSAIKDIPEEIKSRKIIYQSLFGIKDVAELTACFSYAGKIIYSLSKSIASPFVKLIPVVGEQIYESIENATSLYDPLPRQKKNTVFIFDDLERVDSSMSYISLLGFFYQLSMRGCKIICISSLKDLSMVEKNQKKDLDVFIEKAFDGIVYINEFPEEIITNIFNDIESIKNIVGQCIPMFESNIRTAIKTHRMLNDVLSKAKIHKYDLNNKYKDIQILKAAICATKAIYNTNLMEEKEQKKRIRVT